MATARNLGWCLLAGLMGLNAALSVVGGVLALAAGHWLALVYGPAGVLFGYWMAVGGWRRTTWGRVTVDSEALGPVLDETHFRRLILAAAAVPVVLALALGVQVVAGRS
jgi:hypothetical protein